MFWFCYDFWSKLTLKISLQSISFRFFIYIKAEGKNFSLCKCVYVVFFSKVRMWPIFFINHRPFFQVDDLTGFDCHRSSKVDQAFVYLFKKFFFRENPRKISEKQQQPNQPAQNWNQAEFWVEKQILISDKNRSDQLLLVK